MFSLTLLSGFRSSPAQTVENLQAKITEKICACVGEIDDYQLLKPLLDKCYDDAINSLFNSAVKTEVKILINADSLRLINQNIEANLKVHCPAVRTVVQQYILASPGAASCPTNFNSQQFKQAKKRLKSWNGRIVAFDAEVLEVHQLGPGRPYVKVKLGDEQILWVGSMANSGFEMVGNHLRFLGYFALKETGPQEKFHQNEFHVLAFGVIDLVSKKLAMFPGSEEQIKEWVAGKVPKARK